MKIKNNLEDFVHVLQSIHPKEIKEISIELPMELCFQLEREIKEDATPYTPYIFTGRFESTFPITFNFYGTKVKVHSKESKEAIIYNKLKEVYRLLTE